MTTYYVVVNSYAYPISGEVFGIAFGERQLFGFLVILNFFSRNEFSINVFKCQLMREI